MRLDTAPCVLVGGGDHRHVVDRARPQGVRAERFEQRLIDAAIDASRAMPTAVITDDVEPGEQLKRAGRGTTNEVDRAVRVGDEQRPDPIRLIKGRTADHVEVDRRPVRPAVIERHRRLGALEAVAAVDPTQRRHRRRSWHRRSCGRQRDHAEHGEGHQHPDDAARRANTSIHARHLRSNRARRSWTRRDDPLKMSGRTVAQSQLDGPRRPVEAGATGARRGSAWCVGQALRRSCGRCGCGPGRRRTRTRMGCLRWRAWTCRSAP